MLIEEQQKVLLTPGKNNQSHYSVVDGLKNLIKETDDEFKSNVSAGDFLSFWFLSLRLIGVLAAALAFILTALPAQIHSLTIEKWWCTVPVAIAGVCLFIIKEMKLVERSAVHYAKSDMMKFLWLKTSSCDKNLTKPEDIYKFIVEFQEIVDETGDSFAQLNRMLGLPTGGVSQSQTGHGNR